MAWDAIHKEKFWITPSGLFNELVRGAESLVNRQAGEAERRRLRLQANREKTSVGNAREDGEEEQEEPSEVLPDRKDKFGLNLDEFKNKSPNKPPKWSEAVQIACEIHIDEMRTLLLSCVQTVLKKKILFSCCTMASISTLANMSTRTNDSIWSKKTFLANSWA